jgi:hypothetical protein
VNCRPATAGKAPRRETNCFNWQLNLATLRPSTASHQQEQDYKSNATQHDSKVSCRRTPILGVVRHTILLGGRTPPADHPKAPLVGAFVIWASAQNS